MTAVKTSYATVPVRGGRTGEVECGVIHMYSTLSCVCCLGPGTGLVLSFNALCQFFAVQLTSAEEMGMRLREVHRFTEVSAPYSSH